MYRPHLVLLRSTPIDAHYGDPPPARWLMKVYLVFVEYLAPANIRQVPVVIDLYHYVLYQKSLEGFLEVLHPHMEFHHIEVLRHFWPF